MPSEPEDVPYFAPSSPSRSSSDRTVILGRPRPQQCQQRQSPDMGVFGTLHSIFPKIKLLSYPLILSRVYLRLGNENAAENTCSLILNAPSGRFVDLRFSKPTLLEPSRLIWGTTGLYHHGERFGVRGHTIDTRALGFRSTHMHRIQYLANGLLKITPTGKGLTPPWEWEECWRPCVAIPPRCLVLVLKDDKAAGAVLRVGGWCQGLVIRQGKASAERWKRVGGSVWELAIKTTEMENGVGPEMPCCWACGGEPWGNGISWGCERNQEIGSEVFVSGGVWVIAENGPC